MSEHSPARATAIIEAARAAHMGNPKHALTLISVDEVLPPAEAVAALKAESPFLFFKHVSEMTSEEYAAEKKRRGITVRRRFS